MNELLSVRLARPLRTRRPTRRPLLRAAALAVALGAVASCGGGSRNTSNAVGVSNGVSLATSSGVAYLYQSAKLDLSATIINTNTAIVAGGVDWSPLPAGSVGSLSNPTATTITYTAPAGVVGVATATVTATAHLDATEVASVTLTVFGTPVIVQPAPYPANQNIFYAIAVSVAGGTAPFTWTVASGSLPAGLTPNNSTTGTLTISGTPTVLGPANFVMKVTDSSGASAMSQPITINVRAQTACLLQGQYAYVYTGFRGAAPITRAGSLKIAADGSITGIQDYKDDLGTRVAEPVTSGTCTTLTQNRGQMQVNSARESALFEFAVVSTLDSGQLQQDDKTGVVGSGRLALQVPAAFPVATLAGDHSFGVVGMAGGGRRLAVVGRLTSDATGTIDATKSVVDDDEATPLAAAPLNGTFSATDANGRGTASFSFGGQAVTFAYYVVDAGTVFLASADADTAKPRLAGRMTAQVGAGGFGAASLTAPGVLSLWGSSLSFGLPVATTAVGLLSTNAMTAPGTLNVLLDVVDRSTPTLGQSFAGAPYAVAANGRGTLGFGSGATARQFVLYLDGVASGYVLEPVSATGNFGILDAQSGAPFDVFPAAGYVGGTIFAGAASPVTLAPQLLFQNGAISGNLTGSYVLFADTGRMLASVTRNILGGSGLVIYVVSPSKLVVMGDGVLSDNSAISWLQRY